MLVLVLELFCDFWYFTCLLLNLIYSQKKGEKSS